MHAGHYGRLGSPMVHRSMASACGVAGTLLAASSSDRIEKFVSRGLGARAPGFELPEPEAPLPAFLLAFSLAALGYSLFVLVLSVIASRLSQRTATGALLAILTLSIIAFFALYPLFGFPQSAAGFGDEDDAINILVDSTINGSNPYVVPTYIGNPVSPLMGSGLIGAPFSLLFGSAGYQNPFLLLILAGSCWAWLGPRPTLVTVVAAFSSAGFTEYFLLGGDYFLIGACAAASSFLYLRCVREGRYVVPSALLLAVTACTRVSFLTIAVVVVSIAYLLKPTLRTTLGGGVVLSTSVALVLPWLVATGLEAFFPLQAARLLGPPSLQIVCSTLVVALALFALVRRRIDLCYLIGLAAVPVVLVDPGQLFRVASFAWWGVPLFAAGVKLIDYSAGQADASSHSAPGRTP